MTEFKRKFVTFFNGVDYFLTWSATVFVVLGNICLGILLIINIVNITSRLLLHEGIAWIFAWSVVLFVWMVFLTLFVIYRTKKDITVDFLVERLGTEWRFASRLLVSVFTLTLMGAILWQGPRIIDSQVGDIQMVGIPRYAMSIPLFVSCALTFVDAIVESFFAFYGGRTGSKTMFRPLS